MSCYVKRLRRGRGSIANVQYAILRFFILMLFIVRLIILILGSIFRKFIIRIGMFVHIKNKLQIATL